MEGLARPGILLHSISDQQRAVNFAGRIRRFVPWMNASIAPGGTDLRMGSSVSETRLSGPFMNLIQAGTQTAL